MANNFFNRIRELAKQLDASSQTDYVPLTTSEIIDCATATYQCDANDVTENDIKFARHIERLTREK